MRATDLRIVEGNEAGAWIEPELSGDRGSVTGVVPDRFETYARILHPALDEKGNRVTWADVAAQTGRRVHPLAQWEPLVASESYQGPGTLWSGKEPDTGNLDEEALATLCDLLAGHTSEAASCFFGVWGNYLEGSFVPESERFKVESLALPGRDYTVFEGPLSAVTEMVGLASMFSPQLIWPADRAWFVGSEIDFDSTLIGGSARLIEDILGSPDLEAWRVEPGDSLTVDADRVNPPAPWRDKK